jgi:putative accessory gene regulator A
MKIAICESNKNILKLIEDTITKYFIINEWNFDIMLSTTDPEDIINFIEEKKADCYFLDINFGKDSITGIKLGRRIRDLDAFAKLIYISSHQEYQNDLLKEMISTFAFVNKNKNTLKDDIRKTLDTLHKQFLLEIDTNSKLHKIPIKIGTRQFIFDIQDILYFETIGDHKISIYLTENKTYSFYGKISKLIKLNNNLFQCHKSYIVNLQNITELYNDTIIFKNNSSLLLSVYTIRKIKKKYTEIFNI